MAYHGQQELDQASLFIQKHTPGFIKSALKWFGESDQRADARLLARGYSQAAIDAAAAARERHATTPIGTQKFLSKVVEATNIDPRIVQTGSDLLTSFASGKAGLNSLKLGLNNWARTTPKAKSAFALTPKQALAEKAKKARDAMVDNNQFPSRSNTRPANFRGISGDVQGGIKGQPIRMESRPDYQVAGAGLPLGEFNSNTTKNFTPHHRLGIQDNRAFMTGKTGPEAATRRAELAEGGLVLGNTGANYQPVFDGVKSSKSVPKTGIISHDHDQIHKMSDATRKKLGIKMDKKNRDNDTWHGRPIKDLPNDLQRDLQIQLGLQDELAIDKVQTARFRAFKKKFGHLPDAEQRKILLENPKSFANISTHVTK